MRKDDTYLMQTETEMTRIPTIKIDPKKEHKRLIEKKRAMAARMKDPKIQAMLKKRHEDWAEQ